MRSRAVTHGLTEQVAESFPVQILGLLNVHSSQQDAAEPLSQQGLGRGGDLADGVQGTGKNEHPNVVAEDGFARTGIPVRGRAFALIRIARERHQLLGVLYQCCFHWLSDEVAGGRYWTLPANALLQNVVRDARRWPGG